jgi:hypothetical protein
MTRLDRDSKNRVCKNNVIVPKTKIVLVILNTSKGVLSLFLTSKLSQILLI